ncbi:MAG: hypothetical protein ACOYK6_05505 [Chthoniobacterales bacterium]
MKKSRAIISIVTSDYFWEATVLGNSLQEFERESNFIVFVIDYDDRDPDYKTCGFQVLDAKILNPEEWERFVFQYNGFAACCALKPRALLYVLSHYEKAIYLDCDIKLFQPLEEGWKALDDAPLSLTPHNLHPIENYSFLPSYLSHAHIRLTGVFNAGYVGASRLGIDFLNYWWEKVHYNFLIETMIAIYGDQFYLNDAVGLVRHLSVLQHPGYNVAIWNFLQRKVKKKNGVYFVDDRPLVCFHFACLHEKDLKKGTPLANGMGDLFLELCDSYAQEQAIQQAKFPPKKYRFKHFKDGVAVTADWREWMRRDIPELKNISDPFDLTLEERTVIEKIMQGRPKNFHPNKDREINDWKNSFLIGMPTFYHLDAQIRNLESKLNHFERSFPHQFLCKSIAFVKMMIRKSFLKVFWKNI